MLRTNCPALSHKDSSDYVMLSTTHTKTVGMYLTVVELAESESLEPHCLLA